MMIRSMKIDKYRIFKNASIGDEENTIGRGLVVIGGLNRSGKSTFMEILSRLAWGFSKKKTDSVNEKYKMSCKIESEDGKKEYEVVLTDDSKPVVSNLDNNDDNPSMEDLYDINKFAYQNLFCLDLNRLQKTHSEMDGKEREKLQALLLGAGLSDYIQIPALIGEFRKNAVGIAGEIGRPDVKTLGKYYEVIQRGIKLKEHALGQIDAFLEKKTELGVIEKDISDMKSIITNLKNDTGKLGTIEEDYKEYAGSLGNIEIMIGKLIEKSERADTEILRDLLNKHEKIIRKFKNEASGFKVRIDDSSKKKNDLNDEKNKILTIIKKTNSKWDADKWSYIKNICIDETTEVGLNATLTKYEGLEKDVNDLTLRKQSIESQKKNIEKHISKYNDINKNKLLLYLIIPIAVLVPAAVILALNVNMILGMIVGAIPLMIGFIILIYILDKKSYRELTIADDNLLIELSDEMDDINNKLEKCAEEKELSEAGIAILKNLLELPEEASTEMLRKRFESLKNVQDKINDYENLIKKIEEHDNSIKNDLENYKDVFSELNEGKYGNNNMQWEDISGEGDKWFICLELLKELGNNESKKNIFKSKLAEEMDVLPEKIDSKEDVRTIFNNYTVGLIEKYRISENSGTGLIKLLNDKADELEGKYDDLKENRLNCLRDLKSLSTTEKLEEAQKQIDSARADMQKAAEDHAVNIAAKIILEEIQKEFLEKTKYKILSKAAALFKRITSGEYKEILPPEHLTNNDFQAELSTGEIQNSVDILSRGTAEQLFLAVRLSRIMDNKQKLPVIVDDSFANFDTLHTDQTLKIISELSTGNQTFILTCHPELILQIGKNNKAAQYWKLDKGKFTLSDCGKLFAYLSGE